MSLLKPYYQRQSEGLCPRCGEVPSGGFILCAGCRKRQAIGNQALRRRRITAGVCVECTKPLDRQGASCRACLDERNHHLTLTTR